MTTGAVHDDLSITFAALAQPFSVTQQAISKHLKVLERAGLISRSRTAQARPCRLEPGQLEIATEWIDHRRQIWHDRHDRLVEHLSALRSRREERTT